MGQERPAPNRLRAENATHFFDKVLIPAVREGKKINLESLLGMRDTFSCCIPFTGSDFNLFHVWRAALDRVGCLGEIEEEDPRQLPEYTPYARAAFGLLTEILTSTISTRGPDYIKDN